MFRLFLLITCVFFSFFLQARMPNYIYLQGNPWGESVDGDKAYLSEIGVGWQLNKKNPQEAYFFALTEVNCLRFFGKNRDYPKQKAQFNVYGASLVFRWIIPKNFKYLEKYPLRPWVQIGSGPNYFSTRYVCFKPGPLSTKLQFATSLGLGAIYKEHFETGFFYKHFSNANIKYPNYCLDTIEVRVAYIF